MILVSGVWIEGSVTESLKRVMNGVLVESALDERGPARTVRVELDNLGLVGLEDRTRVVRLDFGDCCVKTGCIFSSSSGARKNISIATANERAHKTADQQTTCIELNSFHDVRS